MVTCLHLAFQQCFAVIYSQDICQLVTVLHVLVSLLDLFMAETSEHIPIVLFKHEDYKPCWTFLQVVLRACVVLWKSAGLIITKPSMLWVWAKLQPACLYPWARCFVSTPSLTRAYLQSVCCGECYSLNAGGACAWPAANCPIGKAKWLLWFPDGVMIVGDNT